ncbi:hypothetical protein [Streptomyces sp. DSM 40750]|uniref:hypothetical protein n=1 Tax=Streptomyces sp. DSM 40750 TaxID=2801030 RepID=UPI00214B2366|nr:hypothetical protein JIX55_22715 [Streptomyces sp. DSM 40750]
MTWPGSTPTSRPSPFSQFLRARGLLVYDPDHPPVSFGLLSGALPRGLTLSGLRQDRILNEAAESADPLRLMRLFGITEQTAMRYVTAAHPERTAKLPR